MNKFQYNSEKPYVSNKNIKRPSSLKLRGYNLLKIVDRKRSFHEHDGGMMWIETILQLCESEGGMLWTEILLHVS